MQRCDRNGLLVTASASLLLACGDGGGRSSPRAAAREDGGGGLDQGAGAGGTQATGAGGNANGGTSGMAGHEVGSGAAGTGAGASGGSSRLPVPPGASDRPRPDGGGPNLRVLPWAGFAAAASYTFDDSQPSHVAHLQAIESAGVPVTWYLNNSNNWIAGYDDAWRAALAHGDELGNHTVHHCNFDLSGCDNPLASVDQEIDQCSAYIQNTLDATRAQGRWVIFLCDSLLSTDQNSYAGVDIGSVTGSIEHGKSLGDVWLDTVAHVGAYWLGARAVSTATGSAVGNGMSWTWQLPDHFPRGAFVRVVVDGGELSQEGEPLSWDGHGYYEVALDAGELAWSP